MKNKLTFSLGIFFLIGIIFLTFLIIYKNTGGFINQASAQIGCPSCFCGATTYCLELQNRISAAFGKSCFQTGYDPIADINKDKKVDISDSAKVASCAGDEACCQGLRDTTDPCGAAACVSDGCNGNCPPFCNTAADDPDCGCQADAAHCCGIGCNHFTDPDCPFLVNPFKFGSFQELIEGIINFIFWLAVVLCPLIIIIAAFYFMTSGGDPEKVRKAKNIILYACIGLVIIFLAKGIISFIKQIIGG